MSPEVKGYVPLDGKFPVWHKTTMRNDHSIALHERIVERLQAMGMSAARACKEAGVGADFIRDIERKGKIPSATKLDALATILGTTSHYLMHGMSVELSEALKIPEDETPELRVVPTPILGTIEAGNFREIGDLDELPDPEIIYAKQNNRFPRLSQYALRVTGDSMSQIVRDGQLVICVNFNGTGLRFEHGLLVHVERRRHDGQLVEVTLKLLEKRDGKFWLAPRSHDPKFVAFSLDGDDTTEVVVCGLAVAIQQDLPSYFR